MPLLYRKVNIFVFHCFSRKIREYEATLGLKRSEIERVNASIEEAERGIQTLQGRLTSEHRNLARLETEVDQNNQRKESLGAELLGAVKAGKIKTLKGDYFIFLFLFSIYVSIFYVFNFYLCGGFFI